MKHALFVSFHYPPDGTGSGVLRTLKYTRYLADQGWRSTVLCPDVTAYDVIDEAMLKQVPDVVRIVRTGYWNTKRHFALRGRYAAIMAVPDVWIGWLPFALAAGTRIAREDAFDVIYSTSPPASAHLIAWRLAEALKKPWVADFRDPWIEDPPEPGAPAGLVFRKIDRWLEKKVIERCSHVVTSTAHLRDAIAQRYPLQPQAKLTAIPNGYDEADFSQLPPIRTSEHANLCIVHAGSINPHFRDPRPLFRALRIAADAGRVDLGRVRLRFVGAGPDGGSPELAQAVREAGLQANVEFLPRLPYADGLRELARADVLLLLQASEDTRGLVPAKLYEYLRMQKPVMALVLEGETTRILESTGGGVSIDPGDEPRLVSELANVYRRWCDGTLERERANLSIVRRVDRRELTRELAAIFETLAATPNPSA
ncbi:MAG TPA: glycosyltransferase family 4 protein [Burkholderiales bacterium]|nr:glycosyltransferase family 4 protein [Burkholderiales bacterium]